MIVLLKDVCDAQCKNTEEWLVQSDLSDYEIISANIAVFHFNEKGKRTKVWQKHAKFVERVSSSVNCYTLQHITDAEYKNMFAVKNKDKHITLYWANVNENKELDIYRPVNGKIVRVGYVPITVELCKEMQTSGSMLYEKSDFGNVESVIPDNWDHEESPFRDEWIHSQFLMRESLLASGAEEIVTNTSY